MGNKKSFIIGALLGALTASAAFIYVGINLFGEDGAIDARTQQKIEAIQDMIEDEYLYSDEVSQEELRDATIKGYVSGLGDPYSVYYNEEETTSLFEETTGEFGGIGVVITQDYTTGIITFTTVYENSPGEAAGLLDGDILYKVNGQDISGMDLDHVVSQIRGEKGTTVELTVLRGENMEEYTGVATRDIIEVNTVAYEMKGDSIGYISISGFEKVTYHQFEEALLELSKQNMKGLVIDLRNNPGGNLSTVCEMLDLLLPEGIIVYTEDKNGNKEVISSDEEQLVTVPMAVLVNGNSASASEIFAGAVQDYEIGKIVGTTTYGKGIVQNIYTMTDGTSLKLTTSEYFTPDGRNIHGKGIEPDIVVEYEYDEANPEADNQLEAALDCLK